MGKPRVMHFSLGRIDAVIGYELVDGVSTPIQKTVSAVLEIDTKALAEQLLPRAAFSRTGYAALAGGAVVVRVRK